MFAVITLVDNVPSTIISENAQYLIFDTKKDAEAALAEEKEVGAYDNYSVRDCILAIESEK